MKLLNLVALIGATRGAVFDETEADYTVIVPAGKKHCYMQPMEKGTAFEIEYQVLDGGDLDVDFMLFSPAGRLIVDEKRSEEGLHEVASAEEGDYQICFDNIFSRMTDKTVFWEVFVEDDYDYGDYDDDYDDYYDDDDKPKKDALTGQEKEKGEWKKDLSMFSLLV